MNNQKGFAGLVVVLLVVLGVGVGGVYLQKTGKVDFKEIVSSKENSEPKNITVSQEDKPEVPTVPPTNAIATVNTPVTSAILDCKTNIDCFIAAMNNSCQPAKVTHTLSTPNLILAMVGQGDIARVSRVSSYEIQAKDRADNCTVYEKMLNVSTTINQDKYNAFLAQDASFKTELDTYIKNEEVVSKFYIGKSAFCNITGKMLQKKIGDAVSGNVNASGSCNTEGCTTSDPYINSCTGELYHPNQATLSAYLELNNVQ